MAAARSAKKAVTTQPAQAIDLRYGLPPSIPKDPRLRKFLETYAQNNNARLAAQEAGYSEKWGRVNAYDMLKRYGDYVTWFQAHMAQEKAKNIAIDADAVLQEIAAIAFVNEYDYLVFEQTEREGKTVTTVRRKRLDELTREQMRAIKVTTTKEGALDYELRDKEGRLIDLGKHLGLFNEKVILEHRHRHLHATIGDLSKVPLDKLEAIEAEFEEIIVQHGNQRLIEAS